MPHILNLVNNVTCNRKYLISMKSVSCHGRITVLKKSQFNCFQLKYAQLILFLFIIYTPIFFYPWHGRQQPFSLTHHHKETFKDIGQPTNTNRLPLPVSSSFKAVHQPVPVVWCSGLDQSGGVEFSQGEPRSDRPNVQIDENPRQPKCLGHVWVVCGFVGQVCE